MTDVCQDVLTFLIANVPEGDCAQIALVKDNPAYDESRTPAPALQGVVASRGTCP